MNEVPTSQRKTEQQGRRMLPAARSLESGSEQLWAQEDNEPAVTEGDDAADVWAEEKALSVHPMDDYNHVRVCKPGNWAGVGY